MDYGGPQTEHRQWQEVCPDKTWADMFEVTGSDYKWILKEFETIPQEILHMCVELDEQSLTPVLELTNLVTPIDLESVDDFTAMREEIAEEMSRYGEVRSVLVPPRTSPEAGKVFVEFATVEEVGVGSWDEA